MRLKKVYCSNVFLVWDLYCYFVVVVSWCNDLHGDGSVCLFVVLHLTQLVTCIVGKVLFTFIPVQGSVIESVRTPSNSAINIKRHVCSTQCLENVEKLLSVT